MKLNLLIDTNNIFYPNTDMSRYASKIGKTFPKTDKILESQEETEIFIDKIDTDFKIILQNFSQIDSVWFLLDSKSWRKKVKIKGEYFYKKRRKDKQDNIYWENFNKAITEFIDQNEEFHKIRIQGTEADDLIYLTNDYLLSHDSDSFNIIISTDGDMKQLLGPRTIIYNPLYNNKRLIFPEGMTISDIKRMEEETDQNDFSSLLEEESDESDLSSMFDVSDVSFHSGSSNLPLHKTLSQRLDVEHTNPYELITTKIIIGDDKDDVPSIHHWEKNGKTKRITKKYVTQIQAYFQENNIQFTPSNLFAHYDTVYKLLKTYTKQLDMDKDEVLLNLKRNYKVLYLSRKTIPKILCEKFDTKLKKQLFEQEEV